jgi:hypothetical protein
MTSPKSSAAHLGLGPIAAKQVRDECARLTEQRDMLLGALRPFAAMADFLGPTWANVSDSVTLRPYEVTFGDVKRAVAAIEAASKPQP